MLLYRNNQNSYFFKFSLFIQFFYCFASLVLMYLIGAEMDIHMFNPDMFPGNHVSNISEIVGLADIDGNLFTDIFYVTNEGSQLNVLLMNGNSTYGERVLAKLHDNLTTRNYKIRSVILSDISGTSMLDAVILLSPHVNGPYEAYQCMDIGDSPVTIILYAVFHFASFVQHPLLFYYDLNYVPDLLAIDHADNVWKVWVGKNNNFFPFAELKKLNISGNWNTTNQMYSLYFDANKKHYSAVMLTDYISRSFKFYGRQSSHGYINFAKPYNEINFPKNAIELAQPIIADWCLDENVGLLLAFCTAINCSNGINKLKVYNLQHHTGWVDVMVQEPLHFMTKQSNKTVLTRPLISSLRTMDLNMDNYPDVVTTLADKYGNSFIGVLINNCKHGQLTFNVKQFKNIHATEVIPFDFKEDGTPDLLVNRENIMEMYNMYFDKDTKVSTNFLKVSVLPGHCTKLDCPKPFITHGNYSLPYGIPMPGVTVNLIAINSNYDKVYISGHMVSSTSYLALQLPFYLFGLSENINAIKSLTVVLPRGLPAIGIVHLVKFPFHVVFNPIGYQNQEKWGIEWISTKTGNFSPRHESRSFMKPVFFLPVFAVVLIGLIIVVSLTANSWLRGTLASRTTTPYTIVQE